MSDTSHNQHRLIHHLQKVSSLAVTEDYDTLARYVVEAVYELTGAEVTLWRTCSEADHEAAQLCISEYKGEFDPTFIEHARTPLTPGSSITAEAVQRKKPIIRNNLLQSKEKPRFLYLDETEKHGWHAAMIIPLLGLDDSVLGSLTLYSHEPTGFEKKDVKWIQPFANQVALAIWQQMSTKERISQFQALHEITQEILLEQDLTTLFNLISEKTVTLLNTDAGGILLLDSKKEVLTFAGTYGLSKNVKNETCIKVGESIAGRVVARGEAIIANNIPNDKRFYNPWADDEGFQATINVPLQVEGEILGVLVVINKKKHRIFREDDLHLLSLMANNAAIAIKNARRLDEIQRNLSFKDSVFANAFEAIVAVDKRMHIKEYNRIAQDMLGYEMEEFQDQYVGKFYVARELANEVNRMLREDRNAGNQGRITNHRTWLKTKQGEEVPVLLSASLIEGGSVGFFKDLREEEQVEGLLKAGKAVVSDVFNYQDTLNEIVKQAVLVVGGDKVEGCYSVLMLARGGRLFYEAAYPVQRLKGSREKIGFIDPSLMDRQIGVTGRVFVSKEKKNVGDVKQDADYFEYDKKVRSELGVPIWIEGTVVGVLTIEHPKRNAFTVQDEKALETLAGYAGVAIRNARLVEELHLVRSATRSIAELTTLGQDIDRMLGAMAEQIKTATRCDVVTLHRYDRDQKKFVFPFLCSGVRHEEAIRQNFLPDNSLIYDVLARDTPWVCDTKQPGQLQERAFSKREGIRATVALPLRVRQDKVGVLFVSYREPRNLSADEVEDIQLFADQAAVAIETAELLDQIQEQQRAKVQAVQEISESIAIPLRRGDLFENILRWATFLMGKALIGAILLPDEEAKVLKVIASNVPELKGIVIPAGQGVAGWVAEHKESVMLPDVTKDERFLILIPAVEEARSEIVVPMLKGDMVVGVLNIEHQDKNAFTQDDLALAEAIASLAVVANDNARLYFDMQLQVKEKEEELKEAQKFFIMSEVASEFVHRMNNFAGAIPVRVQKAMDHLNPRDPGYQMVMKQLKGIERNAFDLLDRARMIKEGLSQENMESLEIRTLLNEAVEWVFKMQPNAEERVTVKRQYMRGLPLIQAGRESILATFINIISNAVEAISGKGTITLGTRLTENNGKSFVEVQVQDTGCGIPRRDLAKVFQLFFTTKEHGMGLGLWRDQVVIQGLGGEIEVDSNAGKGSTFWVRIPVKATRSE